MQVFSDHITDQPSRTPLTANLIDTFTGVTIAKPVYVSHYENILSSIPYSRFSDVITPSPTEIEKIIRSTNALFDHVYGMPSPPLAPHHLDDLGFTPLSPTDTAAQLKQIETQLKKGGSAQYKDWENVEYLITSYLAIVDEINNNQDGIAVSYDQLRGQSNLIGSAMQMFAESNINGMSDYSHWLRTLPEKSFDSKTAPDLQKLNDVFLKLRDIMQVKYQIPTTLTTEHFSVLGIDNIDEDNLEFIQQQIASGWLHSAQNVIESVNNYNDIRHALLGADDAPSIKLKHLKSIYHPNASRYGVTNIDDANAAHYQDIFVLIGREKNHSNTAIRLSDLNNLVNDINHLSILLSGNMPKTPMTPEKFYTLGFTKVTAENMDDFVQILNDSGISTVTDSDQVLQSFVKILSYPNEDTPDSTDFEHIGIDFLTSSDVHTVLSAIHAESHIDRQKIHDLAKQVKLNPIFLTEGWRKATNHGNVAPIARDDLGKAPSPNMPSLINVLKNDIDLDGDGLTLVHVTKNGFTLSYTPSGDIQYSAKDTDPDRIGVSYMVSDEQGGVDIAHVLFENTWHAAKNDPLLKDYLPDIHVNATGYLTRVALSTPYSDTNMQVTPSFDTPYFTLGQHLIYWTVVNPTTNVKTLKSQLIHVAPSATPMAPPSDSESNLHIGVMQANKLVSHIERNNGDVIIFAKRHDDDIDDTLHFLWEITALDEPDVALYVNTHQDFQVNPNVFNASTMRISLKTLPKNASATTTPDVQHYYIRVTDHHTAFNPVIDKDKDHIPDWHEGYEDSDRDGIPNYLDSIDACHIQKQSANNHIHNGFLMQTTSGSCLHLGLLSQQANSHDFALDAEDYQSYLENDDHISFGSTPVFNFYVHQVKDHAVIVIPLSKPLDSESNYRKYNPITKTWQAFHEDENNHIKVAIGELGYCPPPESSLYRPLNAVTDVENYHCMEVTIEDGGINDMDGIKGANGSIYDPGYMTYKNEIIPIETNIQAAESQSSGFLGIWSILLIVLHGLSHQTKLLQTKSSQVQKLGTVARMSRGIL